MERWEEVVLRLDMANVNNAFIADMSDKLGKRRISGKLNVQ